MREASLMTEGTTRYLGLDVHKATISVAAAAETGPPEMVATIANEASAVRQLIERLGRGRRLVAATRLGRPGTSSIDSCLAWVSTSAWSRPL